MHFTVVRATASAHTNFSSILHTKNYFFYFTHQFLQNTHISLSILLIYSIKYSFFYNFLLFPHSLPLSLTNPTLLKNTKILNARAIVTVHICTVTVALVHLCTILHPLIVSVFLLKMCKMDYLLYFARFCMSWCNCSNIYCLLHRCIIWWDVCFGVVFLFLQGNAKCNEKCSNNEHETKNVLLKIICLDLLFISIFEKISGLFL